MSYQFSCAYGLVSMNGHDIDVAYKEVLHRSMDWKHVSQHILGKRIISVRKGHLS